MQLLSVNVGKERAIENAGKSGTTGIFKLPAADAVLITRDGLAGDTISDTKHHGGVDQAVYIYTQPDYDWWAQELGRQLEAGTFGENLTISGLESEPVSIGDRFHIDGVVLEVTAPRIPCGTLAARMGDPQFVKRFRQAERPGFYCRVIEGGPVRAGMAITHEPYTGASLSVGEVFRMFYAREVSEADLRRALAAPIAIRDRREKEEKLAALLAAREDNG